MFFKRNQPRNFSNQFDNYQYDCWDDLNKSNRSVQMGSYNNLYPNFEETRLMNEIKENRRRINNLAKRIIRLENYLRIRDTSDYSILDDDKN